MTLEEEKKKGIPLADEYLLIIFLQYVFIATRGPLPLSGGAHIAAGEYIFFSFLHPPPPFLSSVALY
jgi:hypothetical protein